MSEPTPTVPSSVSKEKKTKIFYENGKDALELALSVATMQEEKALRKAEKHHQPQAGKSRPERRNADCRRKRLEEAKTMIAKQQAKAKKKKTKSRRASQGRLRECDDARMTVPEDSTSAAPRKRVSFA